MSARHDRPVHRLQGALQKKAIAWTRWGLLWLALGVAAVTVSAPLVSQTVQMKWFEFPQTLGLMMLPLATFWDAAAHPSSLNVVLVGAVIVLPFIVAYTAFSHYVFRGKARARIED